MNKLRVFQNVYQRGTVQEFLRKNFCTVLLLLFLLPYLISLLCGNVGTLGKKEEHVMKNQILRSEAVVKNKTGFGCEEIPLELYVADKLSRCMNSSYEKEALKAQAVLIRTNLLYQKAEEVIIHDEDYGTKNIPELCFLATAETRGMILEYEDAPIYGAYFKSSSGCTRNAAESSLQEQYPYLKGVPCSKDYLAPGNCSEVIYTKEAFGQLWQGLRETSAKQAEELSQERSGVAENTSGQISEQLCYVRDSAGYVIYLLYDGKWVSGEEVRYCYGLSSADFYIKEDGNDFVFEVCGEGHGLGMSQFAANEMAKEGKDFLNILNYFFEDVTLVKVEG
ncbi:MAG: SpoIID/LytB domain-containing protein [Lachnospiraceae bacterium]|nr:SpoIID/LytB domain-containing protein [Lachnospiraceae bacterium]